MMFYLSCGMNLLIYGVGSKSSLLQVFLQKWVFEEYASVWVRGYHDHLLPRQILTEIVDYIREVFDCKPKIDKGNQRRRWQNTTEILEHIKRRLLIIENTRDF